MKLLAIILFLLIVLSQYPLWQGKGSWLKVWEVDQAVMAEHQYNLKRQNRNMILEAEVKDLKQGTDAIEERARSELGMIKQDEILFQIVTSNQPSTTPLEKDGVTHNNPALNQCSNQNLKC
tara:strand:- start:25 stop:387 length:363 start_codon:yes stop_codon:yes gene_type:complete